MSSADKNLNIHTDRYLSDLYGKRIAILVSEWNEEITKNLLAGAKEALLAGRVDPDHIKVHWVPGSFELILGSKWLTDDPSVDAVIALGCVIQGETRHFEFICNAVANGIAEVGIKSGKPVVFGVLTTDNQQQAADRAGGRHGNKGFEAGITALKMLGLKVKIR